VVESPPQGLARIRAPSVASHRCAELIERVTQLQRRARGFSNRNRFFEKLESLPSTGHKACGSQRNAQRPSRLEDTRTMKLSRGEFTGMLAFAERRQRQRDSTEALWAGRVHDFSSVVAPLQLL
jgi:hypothetical protein